MTVDSRLKRGALRGAAVFLTYGLVERLIVSVLPWLREPKQDFVPENWWFVVTLLAVYAVGGALIGAGAAYLSRSNAERAASTSVKALIVALIVYDVIARVILTSPTQSTSYSAAIAIQGTLGFLLIALSHRFDAPLARAAGSALTISLLLLLPWQAVVDYANALRRAKGMAAIAAVVVALAIGSISALVLRRMAPALTSAQMFCASSAAMMLLLVCPPLWREAPPRSELPRRKTSQQSRPNVVLLSLDTVRADHMALYGYTRRNTPELQKFAQQATLFTHSYSSGDNTLSTHGSIFTGEDVSTHGAFPSPSAIAGRSLPSTLEPFATTLKLTGYTSLGIVANSGHLAEHFGFGRGFDYWDSRVRFRYLLPHQRIYQVERFTVGSLIRDGLCSWAGPTAYDALTRSASEINGEVVSMVPKAQRLAPFLLFVNYTDVHFPYLPPAPFNTLYPGRDPRFDLSSFERIERRRAVFAEERAHLVSQYDGAIAYLDSEIGQLLTLLQQRGLYDDTLIIIVSDHGEALGERGQVSHGLSVDDDQVVVPLIIKFPHQRVGRVVDTPVSSVDLLPTILAAAGLKVPAVLPGRDLAGPIQPRDILSEHYGADGSIERALISGPFKLVADRSKTRLFANGSNDPPEIAAEMKARLDARIAANARHAATAVTATERLNILRALGYIR